MNARYWFKRAATQGHTIAQYALGKLFLSDDVEVRNPEEGLQWLESASENGSDYAAYRLGKEYLRGKIVEKNTIEAVDYLTQSAEAGNQYAQYVLGKLYLEGSDPEQAQYWFTQSAAQGNRYAQFFLDHGDDAHTPSVILLVSRLLHHMSKIFWDTLPSPGPAGGHVESKLLRRIREKKIAMGHKADDHEEQQQGGWNMTM